MEDSTILGRIQQLDDLRIFAFGGPGQRRRPGLGIGFHGVGAAGWFLCTGCGNTVIVRQVLPRCGMCGGRLWERAQLTGAASRAV